MSDGPFIAFLAVSGWLTQTRARIQLTDQVRRNRAHKLSCGDDLSTFQNAGKCLIAGNQVIRAGRISALQKDLVVRIAADLDATRRINKVTAILDKLKELETHAA